MLFDRTFHPDEANQAFAVGKLLETGSYTYNPADHHGPTLYYAAAALQRAAGHADTASLDGTLLRCTPLVFAVLGLLFGIAALKRLGYVSQEPYGSVELTPAGLQHAKDILRKHKTLTTFFVFIGSSEEAAEADACKFEHAISHETLTAIERFLERNKVKVGVGRPFRSRK
jgi:hypothetical protein